MRVVRKFAFLVSVVVLSVAAHANLTLTEVDLGTGDIEITNTSDTEMGGALLEWCIPFRYGQMEAGTFSFAPGEVRTYNIGGPLSEADDLWIYLDRIGGFGGTQFVTTGVVWGSDQSGQGRVNSVVSATGGAAWASNSDFVDISGLTDGMTLQAIFPGDMTNTSAGWTIAEANLGTFGTTSAVGDFDGDGLLTGVDIDALCGTIATGTNDVAFDITGDGLVDSADCDEWLVIAGAANLPSGNPYIRGDANLDGSVDASDFNIWNSSKFTNNSNYTSGDFNCDGFVDTSDFNVWNSVKFTSSDTNVVPEPENLPIVLLLGGVLAIRRGRR